LKRLVSCRGKISISSSRISTCPTSTGTKEIGGLIRAVQEESENAIGAIEAGSSSVMSGVDLSAEAGRTLEEITDASRESGTRIGEIVNSVREQTKAASHVVVLMEKVRESADQIGAASAQQDQGNEIVYRSALTMREVAQQVRRTTEDQSAGFGRIRENVVGVRGAVEKITGSLREQSEACAEVEGFLDGVAEGSHANEAAGRTLSESMLGLSAKAEELREDVERFRG
jgi:methyl-accepting chemotaxis protein